MSLRSRPIHPESLISARIDREITPGETRFLDAHLESCPSCQRQEAELTRICDRLERSPVPEPEAAEIERLLGQLRKLGPPPRPTTEPEELPAPPRGRRLPALILPAVLTLFVAGALIGWTQRPDPPVADEPPAPVRHHPVSMTDSDPATCTAVSEPTVEALTVESEELPEPSRPSTRPAVPVASAAKPPARAVPRPAPELPAATTATTTTATTTTTTATIDSARDGQAETDSGSASSDATEPTTASVFFKGNGKRLSEEARRTLESTADWMQSRDDVRLIIAAHTAPRKSTKKTVELGRKRALEVARYLEKQGVDAFRLSPQPHESALDPDDAGETSGDRVDLVPVP